jgi:glycosyltransferase involved in cell wall biosynthesis
MVAPRRLIVISASLEGGGSERQLARMANYWAAAGELVTFATWLGPGTADFFRLDSRIQRIYLEVRPAGGPFAGARNLWARVARLRALIRVERPDAVLSFIAENNVMALLAARGLPVRVVVSERAHPQTDVTVPLLFRLLRRVLYPRAATVVAQTASAARWLRDHGGSNATVVPNAVRELPVMAAMPRERLILAVGRLTHQKGFDLLLRAFARLGNEAADWRVIILGEGPERESLLALRAALALGERVELPGVERDVETWMARAGLVVQPSRFEGFPNVVLEAMSVGAPVISADCLAGPSDMIAHGVNGRLVPIDDVDALAAAMRELIGNPAERQRLSSAAVAVASRFSLESVMSLWNEVLFPARGSEAGS